MANFAGCAEVVTISPEFTFLALKSFEGFRRTKQVSSSLCFSIDNELTYEPFATDFGPLNLGLTFRFCQKVTNLLKDCRHRGKTLCYYCGPTASAKSNAAVLVGAYQVLVMKRTAAEAYRCLQTLQPFVSFRDAASGLQCFGLTVKSVIEGLFQAQKVGLLNLAYFDLEQYSYFERVENGDSTWIVPGKLLAFPGPGEVSECFFGYQTKVPEDYCPYFRQAGVTAVIRLNRPLYDAKRFTAAGLRHYDIYFPDGSCPSEEQIDKFLSIVENEKGGVAIHCKAGLGRTGVLICCYMMKHFKLTAMEALGYIRVCRPGSVIGQQQLYLLQQEARMHAAGADLPQVAPLQQPLQAPIISEKRWGSGKKFNIQASCTSADIMTSKFSALKLGQASKPRVPRPRSSMLPQFLRFKSNSFHKQNSAPEPVPAAPMAGTARTTAPNGQPRKIPAALLAGGESAFKLFAADEEQPNSAKSDQWRITTGSEEGGLFSPLGAAVQATS